MIEAGSSIQLLESGDGVARDMLYISSLVALHIAIDQDIILRRLATKCREPRFH